MKRYILIKEGFASPDYRMSVMADSIEEAADLFQKVGKHPLEGNIVLEEVMVGKHIASWSPPYRVSRSPRPY